MRLIPFHHASAAVPPAAFAASFPTAIPGHAYDVAWWAFSWARCLACRAASSARCTASSAVRPAEPVALRAALAAACTEYAKVSVLTENHFVSLHGPTDRVEGSQHIAAGPKCCNLLKSHAHGWHVSLPCAWLLRCLCLPSQR